MNYGRQVNKLDQKKSLPWGIILKISEIFKEKLSELILLGLSQMKIEGAMLFYQRGLISFASGSELAGISQADMMKQAMAGGIEPRWSDKMIEEELA